jgi:uncharacterized protein
MRAIYRSLPMALVLAAGLVSGAAVAADAARAERLIEVIDMQQNFVGMQQQLMQGAAQRYVMSLQEQGLTEAQAEAGRPAMESVFRDIQATLSWDDMKSEVVGVFAEVFTNAEIDAAIAFYTSAEGRAFMEKQPQLMERGGQIAERRMTEAMPRIQAGIDAAVQTAAAAPANGGQ